MPVRFQRTLPTEATSTWDDTKVAFDAIVINLGTNDWAKGDPGAPFETAYLELVKQLRKTQPQAWIFAAVGPLLYDTSYTQARDALNRVVSARQSLGDTRVSLLEFATQNPADGLGCDYHPSATEHAKMATVLEAALSAKLGW